MLVDCGNAIRSILAIAPVFSFRQMRSWISIPGFIVLVSVDNNCFRFSGPKSEKMLRFENFLCCLKLETGGLEAHSSLGSCHKTQMIYSRLCCRMADAHLERSLADSFVDGSGGTGSTFLRGYSGNFKQEHGRRESQNVHRVLPHWKNS